MKAFNAATIRDSDTPTVTCGPMRVIKSEGELLIQLREAAQEGCAVFFLPFSPGTGAVIESQGQRNGQLRMSDCMRSFNTCHSQDTSQQS